ncbi:MAG: hypothetical protein J6C06_11075 [Lachnospiraceae bacterium]|nr:hypothetical protein [Lachnospiraceae bacterium]
MNEINAMKESANKALKLTKDINTLVTVIFILSLMVGIGLLMLSIFDPYCDVSFLGALIIVVSVILSYGTMRLGIYIVELLAHANIVKASEMLSTVTKITEDNGTV